MHNIKKHKLKIKGKGKRFWNRLFTILRKSIDKWLSESMTKMIEKIKITYYNIKTFFLLNCRTNKLNNVIIKKFKK